MRRDRVAPRAQMPADGSSRLAAAVEAATEGLEALPAPRMTARRRSAAQELLGATGRSAAPTIFGRRRGTPSSAPPGQYRLRIHLEHSVLDDLDGYRDSEFSVGRGTPGVPDDPLLSRQHALFGLDARSGAASVLWMGRRAGLLLPAAGGGGEVLRDGAQRPLQHGDCVVLLADAGRLPLIVHIGRGAGWPPPPPTAAQWAEICSLAHEHAEAAARREIVHESEQLQRMVEARAAAAGEVARRARRHSAAPAYVEPALVQHKPFLITAADEPAPVPAAPAASLGRHPLLDEEVDEDAPPPLPAAGGGGGAAAVEAAAAVESQPEAGAAAKAARYVAASWPKLSTAWEGLSEARDLKEKKAVAAAAWKNRREYRAGPAHDVHLTATLHAGHAVRGPEQRGQSGEVDVPDPLAFWFGLGIEVNKRHIVTAVHPGGAAADEGTLRVGDRLTSVNGERLEAGGRTLRQLLAALFIVDGEPVTLVGVRPIESHVDAMLEEARRPPPPKADAGIALRRPNWDRRHPSSSGYRGPTRSAAEMLHKPRAWDSQMFALRDWIGYHWSQRS